MKESQDVEYQECAGSGEAQCSDGEDGVMLDLDKGHGGGGLENSGMDGSIC